MTTENTASITNDEILVVEDNVSNLKYLSGILKEAGYLVRAANDGELALRSIEAKFPDLVLLDIQMPGMDGIEVCRRLKKNPATSELPIIFLSAQDETDIKVKALEVGGADYVTKPFQQCEIIARIKTHLSISRSIAIQKQLNAQLRESEERFHDLFEKAPLGYQSLDSEGKFLEVNHAWLETLGYQRGEVIGKWFGDFLTPEYAQAFSERFPVFKAQGHLYSELLMLHKDGSKRYIALNSRVGHNNDGSFKQTHCILKDETERRKSQEELAKSEMKYRTIVENITDALYIHDFKGLIIDCNEAACKMTGYSRHELIGHSLSLLDSDENKRLLPERMQRLLQVNMIVFEGSHIRKDGGTVPIEVCGKVVSRDKDGIIHGFVRDISTRKHTEEALANTQKLESLGLLAGGIAHDFNNLLGGIFGYIDMANEKTKEPKANSYLSKAMNTIERARALTGQLLTFAKGGAPIQKIDYLFPFVEETAKFALSGSSVSCNFDVPLDLWACDFDKNQIGQVIDNLIINAQQAMPVGGSIELSARNITLSEKEHPLLAKGNYVRISITDSGIGISKELISKIFDPFFTTKAKGHGLGLATCYSIIKRHGGYIDVESEQGKGSTFKVYLPASTEAASSVTENTAKTHKGSGTFLIMDDEEVMRDTICDMLETVGYTVICKENGKDAIDFFASEIKAKVEIVGMIFDLTVPGGMGGKEAIEEIRKINKEIPAFVASGYADDPIMKNPAEYGFSASICKPFRKSELSDILNKYIKSKK